MTTVVFDGVIIASDSMISLESGMYMLNGKKVFKGIDFFAIAAGDVDDCQEVIYKIIDKEIGLEKNGALIIDLGLEKTEKERLSDVILITIYGGIYCLTESKKFSRLCEYRRNHEPVGIGSGHIAALAAIKCGKTAAEAIEIAKQLDLYTGGEVQSFRISDLAQEYWSAKPLDWGNHG